MTPILTPGRKAACLWVMFLCIWILFAMAAFHVLFSFDNVAVCPQLDELIVENCNPLGSISTLEEGRAFPNHTLHGVVIFFRHGDRGPLNHVRNMESLPCNTADESFQTYTDFVQSLNSMEFLGSFHAVPLVPAPECSIGQLTPLGIAQLHKLGSILGGKYRHLLKNDFSVRDFVAYSTKYRRTVQSLMAFLFGFFNPDHGDTFTRKMSNVKMAHSYAYCFDHCVCPAAESYWKKYDSRFSNVFHAYEGIMEITKEMAFVVGGKASFDPRSLKDAFLAYVCHDASLPCKGKRCAGEIDVASILSFANWEARVLSTDYDLYKYSILKGYGLINNVVGYLLKMVSEGKPSVVAYSGHDRTFHILLGALGLKEEAAVLPYASRTIFEVYRKNSAGNTVKDYVFRLLHNGVDVTKGISFYEGVEGETSGHFCSIESIVKFLHDNYFSTFNATNFKDACRIH